jgi:hypothetical protein
MALDEPKKTDFVFISGEYKFICDKELFALIQPVRIDSSPEVFVITGRIAPEDVPKAHRHK